MSAGLISFLWFLFIVTGYLALRGKGAVEPKKNLLSILPGSAVEYRSLESLVEDRVYNNRYNPIYRKYVRSHMDTPLFQYLIQRIFGRTRGVLESRLVQAGLDEKISMDEVLSLKVISFLVSGISLFLFLVLHNALLFLIFLIGIYFSFGGIEFYLARRINKRKAEIQRDLPDFLTLLKAVMDTGVSIQKGVELMTDKYPGLLSKEFHKALIEAQANGGNFQLALENMALRNDVEELSVVISDILLAYKRGTSINHVLERQAREMRELYATAIDEKARSLSVKLLVPMVIFSFGPLFVLILAPLLMKFMEAFQ